METGKGGKRPGFFVPAKLPLIMNTFPYYFIR